MTPQEAKDLGFTHHAEMYGFNGFYKEKGNCFELRHSIFAVWLDMFIKLDITFNINKEGFPIKIKGEL